MGLLNLESGRAIQADAGLRARNPFANRAESSTPSLTAQRHRSLLIRPGED
jgi:hypothetical protein